MTITGDSRDAEFKVLIVYFAFVLGIGWALKKFMKTSSDFFLSGRAIPAMVFVSVFMMPFHYCKSVLPIR